MEQIILQLQIPSSFPELVSLSEHVWSETVDMLRTFQKDEVNNWIQKSNDYLNSLKTHKDPNRFYKIAIGLYCMFHFFVNGKELFEDLTQYLYSSNDTLSLRFSAYVVGHISKNIFPSDGGFKRKQFEYALSLIKSEQSNNYLVLLGLFLMKELVPAMPMAFFDHGYEIQEIIWPWLLNKSNEIRKEALIVFQKYLHLLLKYQGHGLSVILNSIYQRATVHLLTTPTDCPQGMMNVLIVLFKTREDLFQSLTIDTFKVIYPFLSNKKNEVKGITISLISQLLLMNKNLFQESLFSSIFQIMITNNVSILKSSLPALSVIVKVIPNYFNEKHLSVISNLFKSLSKSYSLIPEMFQVLISFIQNAYDLVKTSQFGLFEIVSNHIFTNDFVQFFKIIINIDSSFWNLHSNFICEKIHQILQNQIISKKVLTQGILLITELPSLQYHQKNLMSGILRTFLYHKSESIRSLIPKALIHLNINDSPSELHQNLHQIIEFTTADDSAKVRNSFLISVSPIHYKYLVHPIFFHFFQTLSHDTSLNVRKNCFKLIKELIQFSPIYVHSILRYSLIGTLYSLKCSNSLDLLVKNAYVLPSLISASSSLLKIYSSTIIPIFIQILNQNYETENMITNLFDYSLRAKLSTYFFKSLNVMTLENYNYVSPYMKDIMKISNSILKEWGNKKLKLSILSLIFNYNKLKGEPLSTLNATPEILSTIFSLIEKSSSRSLRIQCLKVIGLFGAISSKRLQPQVIISQDDDNDDETDLFLIGTTLSFNDYFLEITFKQLKLILSDNSLNNLKIKALSCAIEALNTKSIIPGDYFPQLVPIVLDEVEKGKSSQSFMLLQRLILIMGQRTVQFVPEIMNIIHKVWDTSLMTEILSVVAALVNQVGPDFSPYATKLITDLLDVLSSSIIPHPEYALKCIPLLASICPSFPHLSQLMIPHFCNIIMLKETGNEIKVCTLKSLRFLVQNTKPGENTTSVIRIAINYCVSPNKDLSEAAFQVLYSIMIRLGSNFNNYTHRTVEKLTQNKIIPKEFADINTAVMLGKQLQFKDFPFINTESLLPPFKKNIESQEIPNMRLLFDQYTLSNLQTPKHWQTWFNGFILSFIKSSPCISIRVCYELASAYRPLANKLFFPSFLSVWIHLNEDMQSSLSLSIQLILGRPNIPSDILRSFAKLIEYMDRAEKHLLISKNSLTPIFRNAQCLALSLHNEQEIINEEMDYSTELLDSLISLYSELGRAGAAKALLNSNIAPEEWLMKLGQWNDALSYYTELLEFSPDSDEGFSGYIASCEKLRLFDKIREQAPNFTKFSKATQEASALNFADAYFFSQEYEKMLFYLNICPDDSIDGKIKRALAYIMLKDTSKAQDTINSAFNLIIAQSAQLFGRRYETLYPILIKCQALYELFELTQNSVNQKQWANRIRLVEYSGDVWWPLVMVRMVTTPHDDIINIHFLELLLRERQFDVFQPTLRLLFPNFNIKTSNPLLTLQYFKYQWTIDEDKKKTIQNLKCLIYNLMKNKSDSNILSNFVVYYVDWSLTFSGRSQESLNEAIVLLKQILSTPKQNYIIWQRWATVNYKIYQLLPKEDKGKNSYAIEAMKGYIHCILSAGNANLSEIIQLLSLFFSTASDPDIFKMISQHLRKLPCTLFIHAIPQLIAQLSHNADTTIQLVKNILEGISQDNYQELIFPLLVAQISTDQRKQNAVQELLYSINIKHSSLMNQSTIMQNCLLLAAITIFEKCSKLIYQYFDYINNSDYNEASQTLQTMISIIFTPHTTFDRLFHQVNFSVIPQLAKITETDFSIEEIESLLQVMLQDIEKFMNKLTHLLVSDVCPELLKLNDTEIFVPGGPSGVTIKSFATSFNVLNSKKRPRKASIIGNDGNEYKYLLKGNEDLRLDQRVMQLFHLINTQIYYDYSLTTYGMNIRTYVIIPLSSNVGLIQWVEGSDTFQSLIAEYRIVHNQNISIEHTMMIENTHSNIDMLRPIQRYEALIKTRDQTDNGDLRKMFWLKSHSSDSWIEKITKFARSSALMSIIGYILGLGDRHPSNFMIDRNSGDVVHIDFGDCFEVARNRILFPEYIPFRLTRMIVNAFGTCGIEGDFRPVCEKVMMLVRENCNSLVSVLEIFVQEPIHDENNKLNNTTQIIPRIWNKIVGTDFDQKTPLSVSDQTEKLINSALDQYNLANLYSGWCPLW